MQKEVIIINLRLQNVHANISVLTTDWDAALQ